jgi:hypothetical protein
MVAGRCSKRTTRERFYEKGPDVNIWASDYDYMKNHRGKKLFPPKDWEYSKPYQNTELHDAR